VALCAKRAITFDGQHTLPERPFGLLGRAAGQQPGTVAGFFEMLETPVLLRLTHLVHAELVEAYVRRIGITAESQGIVRAGGGVDVVANVGALPQLQPIAASTEMDGITSSSAVAAHATGNPAAVDNSDTGTANTVAAHAAGIITAEAAITTADVTGI